MMIFISVRKKQTADAADPAIFDIVDYGYWDTDPVIFSEREPESPFRNSPARGLPIRVTA